MSLLNVFVSVFAILLTSHAAVLRSRTPQTGVLPKNWFGDGFSNSQGQAILHPYDGVQIETPEQSPNLIGNSTKLPVHVSIPEAPSL